MGCLWNDGWKTWECTAQGAACTGTRTVNTNGNTCVLTTTYSARAAELANEAQEDTSSTSTTTGHASNYNSTPAWAVGLLVLGTLFFVGLLVTLAVVLRKPQFVERF